jgi:Flp pilus assembly protein protease CpaA
MIHNANLATVILVVTAAILFYAAWTDLKSYTIRNDVVLVLVVLFFAHALVSGRWSSLLWTIGFATLIFAVLVWFYSRNLLGGGDVKLLTVALLWAGIDCALPFAVLLLVFAMTHTLAARLGWAGSQRPSDEGGKRIPLAPSIAAALIGIFMLGCLRPV